MADAKITALTALAAPSADDILPIVDDPLGAPVTKKITYTNLFAATEAEITTLTNENTYRSIAKTMELRLTLETGVPVSPGDRTAIATLYLTPYLGGDIALYSGGRWYVRSTAEISISLAGKTANKNYDVFCYDNAGTPTLELLIWTDNTTRATTLSRQDGVLVKNGDATRRYLGTIRINSTGGQCEDTMYERYVWNMYNRVPKLLRVIETTDSWTYQLITWRQTNAAATNKFSIVAGLQEDVLQIVASLYMKCDTVGYGGGTAVGEDSTTVPTAGYNMGMWGVAAAANGFFTAISNYGKIPSSVGYHYYAWLEAGPGSSKTDTMYGDSGSTVVQSGMIGFWRC